MLFYNMCRGLKLRFSGANNCLVTVCYLQFAEEVTLQKTFSLKITFEVSMFARPKMNN
jgi:hypothetical protein